jgi:apolipoprotein N-acyltransferase
MLALAWLGGTLRLADAPAEPAAGVRLRLVQGNIGQHHKWQPELRARWFRHYLELSARPAAGIAAVIWPESATPYPLDREPEARALIARVVPPGGLLLTGGERFDLERAPPAAWNSLFALDDQGRIVARYDKRHLVPFGEFLPWRAVLGRLGLEKLTAGSIDFQPGPGPVTLSLPGLPPFSPLICYEAIFPAAVVDPDARPAWLLNVTNDAWFGRSSGRRLRPGPGAPRAGRDRRARGRPAGAARGAGAVRPLRSVAGGEPGGAGGAGDAEARAPAAPGCADGY